VGVIIVIPRLTDQKTSFHHPAAVIINTQADEQRTASATSSAKALLKSCCLLFFFKAHSRTRFTDAGTVFDKVLREKELFSHSAGT
jgi:hypothetical protein